MEKPVEPTEEDCCKSGCNPCVFDIYDRKIKIYEKYLQDGEYSDSSRPNGISDLDYTKFIVVKNLNWCPSHYLIAFKRLSSDHKKVWWSPGDHFLYKHISSVTSCTRAYTPIIDNNVKRDYCEFSIIIKKYENGLVSSQLCNLDEGSITMWRGPYGNYEIEPNKFSRIVMIAQGTGIAPFITIINEILDSEDNMTKITLIYCCKSLDTILFRDELYAFNSYWNFTYEIYLSQPSTECVKYQEPIKFKKLRFEDLLNFQPFSNNDQILICGSLKFIEDYDNYFKKTFPSVKNTVLF